MNIAHIASRCASSDMERRINLTAKDVTPAYIKWDKAECHPQ